MSVCQECLDTGRSNKGLSQYLDCAKCGAAEERAALESEFFLISRDYSESIWAIHQRAKRIEREQSKAK